MAVHFIHIGKTGGSAIKGALRQAGRRNPGLTTSHGPVQLHRHAFGLDDVAPDDFVFFCVRDPLSRFLSGFYSRLRKGQPRYNFEWTERERLAFERFATPQQLAAALGRTGTEDAELARKAMRGIRHLRPMTRWLTDARSVKRNASRIIYIGRQETLDADWKRLRTVLDIPADISLPTDPLRAHRHDPDEDWTLDEAASATLRRWYAEDIKLLKACERLRQRRGWPGSTNQS